MSNKQNPIPDFEKLGRKVVSDAVRYSSVHALNFFKDSFQKQGWTDTSYQAWDKRKNDTRTGGALLVQTGNLRDSLQILSRSKLTLVFGTNAPYSQVHNEGGTLTIPITPKSRKFFWFMFKSTGQSYWKWMALTKKDRMIIKMPKRQYIGHSETLMRELNTWWVSHIEREFKKHINNI
ncbi:phage virion morphogenesis protein [Pseudotenacibaculum haliotis]|uniref:Phage virion morphogenesis protein n=1 Tax=Pseudotenacibaculum haliotis TaxID=1862138 RepID=A0ABW5LMP6_9FLAO